MAVKDMGGICTGKNKKAVQRNRTELSKLSAIICTGRIFTQAGKIKICRKFNS